MTENPILPSRETVVGLNAKAEQQTARLRGQQSLRDVTNREMASGQQVAIRNILKYDPRHPLIQIALAPFGSDTAEYPRNFGLHHLPADAKLWLRAAEMLLVQKQPALAARAIERVGELDAPSAADLRARLKLP